MVKSNNYNLLEHFYVRNNECDALDTFNAQVTPYSAIIDGDQRLVWKGHHMQRNYEQDLNEIL